MILDSYSTKDTAFDTATIVVLPEEDAQRTAADLNRRVDHLERLLREYESTPDERVTPSMVEEISTTIEDIGQIHPDPKKKKSLFRRAKEFRDAPMSRGRAIARDLGIGLGLIVLAPILVSGAMIAAAGGVIYGYGMFCKGLGGVLTFGLVGYKKKKNET